MMRYDRPVLLDNPRAWRTYLGGSMLSALHGETGEDGHFPEEWILSVVSARNAGREHIADEGLSHLAATGETLKAYIEANPTAALGEAHTARYGAQPGMLLKLIDAAERLTVQVHPDRETAMALFHSPFGKTECWHILGGRTVNGEKPCVYFGFRQGTTREQWKRLFDQQDIPGMLDCLYRFEVQPGDTLLIEGGVPHAIGAGCLLAEIQEPTDYTIRVERVTPSGFPVADSMCHQGLGFERMFDCFHYDNLTREQVRDRWLIPMRALERQAGGEIRAVVQYTDTPMFRMNRLEVWDALDLNCGPEFSGLYVLSGEGELVCADSHQPLCTAQQYLIPAGVRQLRLQAKPGKPLTVLQCFGPKP
ncbi:MAG TPA: class I mannose-6-phosphate isomerase [Candidatus Limiplasma sp.]|nr:class I mannose-6-phosphate isomerase [Candidatus Limiplasma sp.]HPS81912.1 class I mannose-6-phosphate isomerase [Candidatus Limiplasma sp.]